MASEDRFIRVHAGGLQQTGVNLAPAQAAILAQAVSEPPVQLAEAAMIAGINLAQAAEALACLQRRQWLARKD